MNRDLEQKLDIREEVPIRSFSIAAFICKKEKNTGKYLILKRCSEFLNNSWQMVSGRIEKGETAWQAALREIKEETGIVPDRLYSSNKADLGEAYADYFTFSLVRNPWDSLVSWYNMIRTYGPANTTNRFWAYVLANSSCFEEFIKNCTGTVSEYGTQKSILRNQVEYLSDDNGEIIVDQVGRFENFTDDVRRILTSASITVPMVIVKADSHMNITVHTIPKKHVTSWRHGSEMTLKHLVINSIYLADFKSDNTPNRSTITQCVSRGL